MRFQGATRLAAAQAPPERRAPAVVAEQQAVLAHAAGAGGDQVGSGAQPSAGAPGQHVDGVGLTA